MGVGTSLIWAVYQTLLLARVWLRETSLVPRPFLYGLAPPIQEGSGNQTNARLGGEVKRGQTTPVPSTVVSAKATDTLGSDTPGTDTPGKDLSAVKLWRK